MITLVSLEIVMRLALPHLILKNSLYRTDWLLRVNRDQ